MKVQSFLDLDVWKKAVDLADEVYQLASKLPAYEMYALSSQNRRAAVSVSMNVAKGSRRNSSREFVHSLGVAQGSLAGVQCGLVLVERLHGSSAEELVEKCNEIGRMIRGLQRSLLARSD